MKEQRWPGDYERVSQEFARSRAQEEMGMRGINADFLHDYLTLREPERLDLYQMRELEPSASTQLDVIGMQPHAREYLEYTLNCERSERKFEQIGHQTIDYSEGIQFSGTP